MKKFALFSFVLLCLAGFLSAQTVFSIRPGLQLNNASLGYYNQKLVLFGGIQFGNLTVFREDEFGDNKTKIHVYMPYIGSEFILREFEDIRTSILFSVFKPLVFGKEIVDGQENTSFKEDMNNIGIWGGQLAFKSAYFLNESFSIGGEFGFRLGNYNFDDTGPSNYKEGGMLNMTYTAISLNFYFGNKEQ